MSFYGQFMARFTPEQQQTELVKAWAAIGVDTEKTLLEQISAQNRGLTDINGFYADIYRSWLAFFLRRVPNAFAPRSSITVTNPESNPQTITINSSYSTGDPASLSSSGVPFVQPVDISIAPGSTVKFTAIQGKVVRATGTYNEIINVATTKVDLSTLKVYLQGKEIPEVDFTSSYTAERFMGFWNPNTNMDNSAPGASHISDNIGKEHRGEFYLVVEQGNATIPRNGSSDTRTGVFYPGEYVMYDGDTWARNLNSQSLLPKQMEAAYAIPYNGYFAYYQSGSLYIRIFPGDLVQDPEGKDYEITFIDTDGSQGNALKDTITYTSKIIDVVGNSVQVIVKNTNTTLGYSSTDAGELSCLLRERFFSTINVSSIPEYTAWFNAQPEIGDCKVLSDFERKLANSSEVDTGFVSVYAVDLNGDPIQTEGPDGETNPTVLQILERITPYKDVAALRFLTSPVVHNVLRFSYLSSSDDTALIAHVTAIANNFYSVDYTKQYGMSLFESLDLAMLLQHIGNAYSSIGLAVQGYHYYSVNTNSSSGVNISSYEGEKLGNGYYLYYEQETDSSGNPLYEDAQMNRPKYKAPIKFEERLEPGNPATAKIYTERGVEIGIHTNSIVSIQNNSSNGYPFTQGKLECYWPMIDQGILDIGRIDAVRKLATDCVDGAVIVKRY